MSHRFDCPTTWEARREGERAYENGSGSWRNPYKSDLGDDGCPEAERSWRRGFDESKYAEERRQEELASERRAEQHRIEQENYERMWLEEREQEEALQMDELQEQPKP